MTTAIETDLAEEVKEDVVPACEHIEAYISEHDFKLTRFGERCKSPAEWTVMVHSLRSHLRHVAFICERHRQEMASAICPNPVCQAPRLSDVRPI
jgi:hypothetical protein